ncbi:Hypothetical protein LUCI_1942 [Lucifera butyrica]|uniref:Uncharacterized protein n=1 Tax=Lucifera butyrica TaxID=1351585 RepID=A0A498R255_9FIRM|nr:hypothetical protein [Lucifera butyrica]VBB06706.1 Hypothetical protein LUCI_1942 [Lucifera butyrica]
MDFGGLERFGGFGRGFGGGGIWILLILILLFCCFNGNGWFFGRRNVEEPINEIVNS